MNMLLSVIELFKIPGGESGYGLTGLIIHLFINLLVTVGIVRVLYYPNSRRRDYFFTFILTSTTIFMLLYLLVTVEIQIGFAMGLFAIFGILRYRTDALPPREMTYLFTIIGISVINALAKKLGYVELITVNGIFYIIIWMLENKTLLKHVSSKRIVYDKIELIKPERYDELLADLKQRTGLHITKVEIGPIDFLKDTALLNVYYSSKDTNQADYLSKKGINSDDDDD
jgi:Domain of unknown function (DUF4956)